jgi:hypothetical protein
MWKLTSKGISAIPRLLTSCKSSESAVADESQSGSCCAWSGLAVMKKLKRMLQQLPKKGERRGIRVRTGFFIACGLMAMRICLSGSLGQPKPSLHANASVP